MRPPQIQLALALTVALLATPTVGLLADEAGDQFAVGAGHYAAKRWALAAEEFATFVERYPDHAKRTKGLFFCGEALVQAGKLELAQRRFVEVLETKVESGKDADQDRYIQRALFRAGECAFLLGQHNDSEKFLAQFNEHYPDDALNAFALYYLGEIAREHGDLVAAQRRYQEALRRFPDGAKADDCRFGLADAYLGAKEYDDAAKVLEPLLKREDRQADANVRLAQVYQAEERWELAAKCIEAAIAAGRNDAPGLRLQAAEALLRCKQYERAIDVLQKGSAAGGNETRPASHRYALALAQQGLGRHEDALPSLSELAGEPDRNLAANAKLAIVVSLVALKRYANAADVLTELISDEEELEPGKRAWTLAQLAMCCGHTGDFAEAKAALATLSSNDDELAAATSLELGKLAAAKQRPADAQEFFTMAAARGGERPTADEALLQGAQLSAGSGKLEEALASYERLIEHTSDSAMKAAAIYGAAWCLVDLDREREAIEQFEQIHKHHVKSSYWGDATFRLAFDAAEAKQFERSLDLVNELTRAADEQTAKVSPETLSHGLYLRAQLAVQQKRYGDAEQDVERLTREFQHSTILLPAELLRADIAYRRGDFAKAAVQFDALAEKVKDRTERWAAMVWLRRAQLLAREKQWSKAREIAEQIALRFGDFELQYEADYLIGRALAADAHLSEARKWYQKVVQSPQGGKTETAAMAQWMIGETFLLQENHQAAVREYLRVEVLYSYPHWQAAGLMQAARCFEQMGQWKDAADAYERLGYHYPETQFAGEAKQRLQQLQQQARKADR
jgi:TolA-binding protein